MKPIRVVVSLAVIALATVPGARAQFSGQGSQYRPSAEAVAVSKAIIEEIDKNSELMANLEYLCDMIGPRLTGSPQLKTANQWTRDKFKEYGLENAHLEPYKIAHSWARGTARGRVVAPAEHRLLIESAGWAPSTDGPVRGPVVVVKAEKPADLDAYKGKLKGAWIITREPSVQPTPRNPEPENPFQSQRRGGDRRNMDFAAMMRTRNQMRDLIVKEGAAGMLRDSNKEHGLVDMTGATMDFGISKLPEAFLSNESYALIYRLQKRGPVELEIDIKNDSSDGEVEVHNTVAELPGSEKPGEVVIIGGHLDSWDLGTGATDNGTGTMAVLEAARALKAINARPKRTIRFVMFTGEEQGLHGSKEYARTHKDELDKVAAVMVHDMGTGKVTSIGLQGRYDLREEMDHVVAPFQRELNLDELSMRSMSGTDHLSFLPAGVPAFAVVQDRAEYRKTHHTESDTFEKVYPDEINQGAKVLACWAYNVANLPDLLPRDPKVKKQAESSEKKESPESESPEKPKPINPAAGAGAQASN